MQLNRKSYDNYFYNNYFTEDGRYPKTRTIRNNQLDKSDVQNLPSGTVLYFVHKNREPTKKILIEAKDDVFVVQCCTYGTISDTHYADKGMCPYYNDNGEVASWNPVNYAYTHGEIEEIIEEEEEEEEEEAGEWDEYDDEYWYQQQEEVYITSKINWKREGF